MHTFLPYLNQFENNLRIFVEKETRAPEALYHMIQYHMGWMDAKFLKLDGQSGKRLRPLILMLCCEAVGGEWQTAVPAAVAVELLHNFTLIHDDIEDRDELRHGQPTVWAIWGIPQAINAGDALYALAHKALLSLQDNQIPENRLLKASQVYTNAIIRITEGQYMDIGFETQNSVLEKNYLEMISGKTAALFSLSSELGALIAGVDSETQKTIKDFGHSLGMAFQMQDDILGLWGDPDNTGKPVGSDLIKAKKTLPIIHCALHSDEFRKLIQQPIQQAELERAMRLLNATQSLSYAQTKSNAYLDQALSALDSVMTLSQQDKIRQFVFDLVQRER